jgi:hypothetical protein
VKSSNQKRIKLFKGLTINLSQTGFSFVAADRGQRININGDKGGSNVGNQHTKSRFIQAAIYSLPTEEISYVTILKTLFIIFFASWVYWLIYKLF